mmetsp:Transcript_930/g.3903  ORF Transcript_930/g.3903 Transcript_930/m.3903 type:complete len:255 (-) Transcript_930:1227-1991(-)
MNDVLVASSGLLNLLQCLLDSRKLARGLRFTHFRLKKLLSGVELTLLRTKHAIDVFVKFPERGRGKLFDVDFDLIFLPLAQSLFRFTNNLYDSILLVFGKFSKQHCELRLFIKSHIARGRRRRSRTRVASFAPESTLSLDFLSNPAFLLVLLVSVFIHARVIEVEVGIFIWVSLSFDRPARPRLWSRHRFVVPIIFVVFLVYNFLLGALQFLNLASDLFEFRSSVFEDSHLKTDGRGGRVANFNVLVLSNFVFD